MNQLEQWSLAVIDCPTLGGGGEGEKCTLGYLEDNSGKIVLLNKRASVS